MAARQRSGEPRAEPVAAARQDAADRRERRRTATPTGYRIPPDNPFLVGDPARASARSGASACAIRGATASTIRRSAAPARSSSGMWDRTDGKRSTTSRQPRRAELWLANSRGAHDEHPVAAAGVHSTRGPDLRIRSQRRRIGDRWLRLPRPGAAVSYRGRYFYADYFGRAWSIALTISATTGEAQASDRTEHTAEFGEARLRGGISSFGIDALGELYIVNHQDGLILKIAGPPVAPPTPIAPRIIR